jgi:hypothetical protein
MMEVLLKEFGLLKKRFPHCEWSVLQCLVHGIAVLDLIPSAWFS